tara:strand:+ start:251 stop:442 length:192 start_codon:yes stop_codon:yes gene_type:complete
MGNINVVRKIIRSIILLPLYINAPILNEDEEEEFIEEIFGFLGIANDNNISFTRSFLMIYIFY